MSFLDDDDASSSRGDLVGGRFELREPLGEGGMGVVHAAWDRDTKRVVAVKILADSDDDARARFAREVAALAALTHVALVRPFAHGLTDDGAPFLAMERLSGRTLADRLRDGPLRVREALALGKVVADALSVVHAAGIVHRDVKPSNLFLCDDEPEQVRLFDFGLARGRAGLTVTRAGALVGTPGYLAPEQVRGERGVGPGADVFALGAVLFECLAGRAVFFGDDPEQVLTKILLEDPPLLRALRPAVPLALEGLVESMLAKDPGGRPGAADVVRALDALAQAIGGDAADDCARRLGVGTLVAGKYRVEGTLGEGGMGVILAARHEELGRPVALKLLRASRSGDDQARLFREARALSQIESEHVARVLDMGRLDDGEPFMVIERLEGQDLARVLRERGPLPAEEAVDYLLQACEALAEAHALGIVHRDIKPSNLFLVRRRDGSSCIKVLDFGVAKVEGGERSLTGPSAVIGSPWYMSPEQLRSSKHVDARTDIWALGVLLHELIAGAPPFDAETAAGVGACIAVGEPSSLSALRPEVPPGLEAAILRCLAKRPGGRFRDIAALARALTPFSGGARDVADRIARVLSTRPPPDVTSGDKGTTSSAWGAAHRASPRATLLVVPAAVAVVAGVVLMLRSTGAPKAEAPLVVSAPPVVAAPAPPEPEPSQEPAPEPTSVPVPSATLSAPTLRGPVRRPPPSRPRPADGR